MPTIASFLPPIRRPSIPPGLQPFQPPDRISFSPSTSRRGTARISAIVMSAVSSVSTPGVWVTMMSRARRLQRDVIDPRAVIGDEAQLFARAFDQPGIDHVEIGSAHV